MTTRVWGNWIGSYWRLCLGYDLTTTNTQVTITIDGTGTDGNDRSDVAAYTDWPSASNSLVYRSGCSSSGSFVIGGTTVFTVDSTYGPRGGCSKTYTRGHSAQTVTISGSATHTNYLKLDLTVCPSGTSSASTTVTIPAKPSYTVSYNNNGGGTTPSSQTKWYGESLNLQGAITNRTNYVFKNWNTAANGSGTAYNAGAAYTGNSALTLYAQWYAPYTVSYNANGGTGAPSSQTKVHNTNLVLTTSKPTRTGYTFLYWNTKSDGSGTTYQSGATYSANATQTLYAIWWENPSITTPTVTRCDSQGNADACGGYVNVSVPWSINASQAGTTQTAPSAFSITVAGNSQSFSDTTVPSGTSGTRTVILGDGTLSPSKAYTVTVSVTDSHGTTISTSTMQADSGYTLPSLTNVSAALVDSNGNPDTLGKRVLVTATYSVYATTVQTAASALSASITHNASDTEAKQNLSSSGTETWTFGPYDYDDMDPHGGYTVGTISLSDGFNTTTLGLALASTGYAKPSITSISAYRTEAVVDGGTTTYEEADDGTCLGIDLEWAIAQTASQTDPSSVTVVVKDLDAEDAAHETVAVREFEPTGASAILNVYPDAIEWPDDVVIDGELINTAHRYTVDVTLSDLYSDEVASAVAVRSDMVTVTYFTMDFLAGGHGVAFGKPSTRDLLDVGMQAQFDVPVLVADRLSMPAYVFATLPAQADIPAGPALVLTEDDFGLYYFDGDSTTS